MSTRASGLRLPIGWILIAYVTLFAVAVAWSVLRGDRPPFVPLDTVPMAPGWATLAGLGSGLLVALLSHLTSFSFAWARRLETEFARLLGPLTPGQILLIAAASSIGEEAFFRGAVQPWLGLVLTSVVFGLLHVGPSRVFLPWTIMALVMGFALGLLFVWTGSLVAPILCHGLINGINLQRIVLRARGNLPVP